MLNNFVHLGQTKCIKGTFLVFRSTDTALYLLNFYSCHSFFSLSIKYSVHTDASVISNHLGVAKFLKSLNSCLHQVMGVGRTLGFGKDIRHANALKDSTHGTASHHTSTCRCRTEQHMSATEADFHFMRNGALNDRNAHEILLSSFNTLCDGCSYFTSLTKATADDAIAVANHNDCSERECTTTLCHLRNTVDCDESVFKLNVIRYFNSIYSHDD